MGVVRLTLKITLLSLCVLSLCGAQELPPEWDARKLAQSVVEASQRLTPIMAKVNPAEWTSNGAPPAYIYQLERIKNGADYVAISAKQFSADPQKLSAALDTYLRIQWLETQIGSLEQGVRKYQNPALADLLMAAVSDNATARTQLQQYVLDLANYRETEMKVMAKEAQKCRVASTQPANARRK